MALSKHIFFFFFFKANTFKRKKIKITYKENLFKTGLILMNAKQKQIQFALKTLSK